MREVVLALVAGEVPGERLRAAREGLRVARHEPELGVGVGEVGEDAGAVDPLPHDGAGEVLEVGVRAAAAVVVLDARERVDAQGPQHGRDGGRVGGHVGEVRVPDGHAVLVAQPRGEVGGPVDLFEARDAGQEQGVEGVHGDPAGAQGGEDARRTLWGAGREVLGDDEGAVHGEREVLVPVEGGQRAVEVAGVEFEDFALDVGVADVEVDVRDEVHGPFALGFERAGPGLAAVEADAGLDGFGEFGDGEADPEVARGAAGPGQVVGPGAVADAHFGCPGRRCSEGDGDGEVDELLRPFGGDEQRRRFERDARVRGERVRQGLEGEAAPGDPGAEVVAELLAVAGRAAGVGDGAGGGRGVERGGDADDVLPRGEGAERDREGRGSGDGAVPVDLRAVLADHGGVEQAGAVAVDVDAQVGAGPVSGVEVQAQEPVALGHVGAQFDAVVAPPGGGVERAGLERGQVRSADGELDLVRHGRQALSGRSRTAPCSVRAAASAG
nr:hypothetical protein GCM10025732_33610 [Glycomyces mayteni]